MAEHPQHRENPSAMDSVDHFVTELRELRAPDLYLEEVERVLRMLCRSDDAWEIKASDALRDVVFRRDLPLRERLFAWRKISLDLVNSLGPEH